MFLENRNGKKPELADDLLLVASIEDTQARISNQQADAFELFISGRIDHCTYNQMISEASGEIEPMQREASKKAALDHINGTGSSSGNRLAKFVFHQK